MGTAARLVALVASPAVATTFLGRAATTPRRATNVAAAVGTTVAARALTALALPFRRVPASRLRRPAPRRSQRRAAPPSPPPSPDGAASSAAA